MGLRNALRLSRAATEVQAALDSQHGAGPGAWGTALPWASAASGPDYSEAVWSGWAGNRALAMSIPSFAQGVHVIAGTCGTFPFRLMRDRSEVPPFGITAQPDPDQPASITWTRLVEDMVLFPYAWLRVTERYAPPAGSAATVKGFPRFAVYEPFENVTIDPDTMRVYVEGRDCTEDMLRFDSPVAPGALVNGRRILTTALLIEDAVRRFARMDIPAGYLQQTGGPDMQDEDIIDLLDGWESARAKRNTGFLNAQLRYESVAFNPEQLQLTAARDANAVDVARLLNLPPMSVNAQTNGSLTYSTTESQGRMLLNQTLAPYLSALTGRLSMGDITPRGMVAVPVLDQFLRSDAEARSRVAESGIRAGWLTVDEVRAAENLPPLTTPTPTPEATP